MTPLQGSRVGSMGSCVRREIAGPFTRRGASTKPPSACEGRTGAGQVSEGRLTRLSSSYDSTAVTPFATRLQEEALQASTSVEFALTLAFAVAHSGEPFPSGRLPPLPALPPSLVQPATSGAASPARTAGFKISTEKWIARNQPSPTATPAAEQDPDDSSHGDDYMAISTRRSSSRPLQHTQSLPATSARPTRGSPMVQQQPQNGDAPGHLLDPVAQAADDGHYDQAYEQDGGFEDDNVAYENGAGAGDAEEEDEEEVGRGGRSSRAKKTTIVKDSEDEDAEGDQDGDFEMEEEQEASARPTRGARKAKAIVHASDEDDDLFEAPKVISVVTTSGRRTTRPAYYDGDETDEDEEVKPTRAGLRRGGSKPTKSGGYSTRGDFVEPDDEFDEEDFGYGQSKRSSGRLTARQQSLQKDASRTQRAGRRESRDDFKPAPTRKKNRKADVSYEGEDDDHETETEEDEQELELGSESDDLGGGRQPRRTLREKRKIDYFAVPTLDPVPEKNKGKGKQRDSDNPFAGLPMNMTGAQWAALYPDKNAQSDSVGVERLRRQRARANRDSSPPFGSPTTTCPTSPPLARLPSFPRTSVPTLLQVAEAPCLLVERRWEEACPTISARSPVVQVCGLDYEGMLPTLTLELNSSTSSRRHGSPRRPFNGLVRLGRRPRLARSAAQGDGLAAATLPRGL